MLNTWKKSPKNVKLSQIKLAYSGHFRYILITVEKCKAGTIKSYLL
ncbi:Hypothetical protein EAG7_02655 [Klebsiella aerogenes]|nr:Hypothetical protein EAG7_02655 [Klebsiella aerogenes]PVF76346.1 hypothetical protein CSC18_3649 [Klebsiella aerogenes]CCG31131.1 hypothetical protein [Klebsiella aerogenes EA1509E]